MKKAIIILILPLLLISCAGWKSVPNRLESFVTDLEQTAKTFDEENWDRTAAEYHGLMDTYYKHRGEYSSEERNRVYKAVGKYQALLLLNGMKNVASSVDNLIRSTPAYLNGVEEAFNNTSEEWSGQFDLSELEQSFYNLEESFDSLADHVSEGVESILKRLRGF